MIEAPLYSIEGKEIGKIELPEDLFGQEVKEHVIYEYVKLYLNNQRQGTVNVKGRSEVSYSTRKIYSQKGTGRARHGAISANIFVKGGKAHGPKPRDFYVKIPKRLKETALISAFSQRAKENAIKIIENLKFDNISTKNMNKLLRTIVPEGTILLVLDFWDEENKKLYLSGRNLPYLDIRLAQDVNAYDVIKNKYLIFKKEVIDSIVNEETETGVEDEA